MIRSFSNALVGLLVLESGACASDAVPENESQASSSVSDEDGDDEADEVSGEAATSGASQSLMQPLQPVGAPDCGIFPGDCYWNVCENNNASGAGNYFWKCSCQSDWYPMAGGCSTDSLSARLIRSNSYENNDHTDMIDDNECAVSATNPPDGSTGWACVQNAPNNTVTTTAVHCCRAAGL
jgi:hypothetical protein